MVRLNFLTVFVVTAAFGFAAPIGVSAQSSTEMSAEEISNAFKKQKTRGLVIVPSDQQPANSNSDTAEVASSAEAATNYTAVEKSDQVNVQISFDFDSASLREDQKPRLAALCQAMQSVDATVFQIIGHTDSSGKASYNERLSLLRAQEVKHYLVSSCGIEEFRLEAIGMGETIPYDSEHPRADINRRVEFQALG